MAWLAVDKNGAECIYDTLPERNVDVWSAHRYNNSWIELPHGSIAKLIGRELTWSDEPVKIE